MEDNMFKALETVSAIGALVMAATPFVALGGVAHAQTLSPQQIMIADLDLSRPADVQQYNVRVERAAQRMCSDQVDLSTASACREAIREEAAQKLDAIRAAGVQSASASASWTVAGR
jgi:UrcA family protein